MSFQYSAIGDNTPENREHLEKLGYKLLEPYNDSKMIKTEQRGIAILYNPDIVVESLFTRNCISCIGNPALFQAVSAIRDDSDYMQWFVFDKDVYDMEDDYIQGDTLIAQKGEWYLCKDYNMLAKKSSHKATIEELQEHLELKQQENMKRSSNTYNSK